MELSPATAELTSCPRVAAKKNPETCHIPIIVVTAIGQEDDVAKANAMGADAYLTKPFSSSNLIETIQTQLNNKSSVQAE